MDQLFSDMQERFETLYKAIEKTVADLPDEALDWKPARDMNSLAVLLVHTAGALRFWVGDVAGGQPSGRVRSEEFETRQVDAAELMARLRAALDDAGQVLGELDPAGLGEMRQVADRDESHTVGWALLHALEHTAIHTGHIQITRQLWDQRNG